MSPVARRLPTLILAGLLATVVAAPPVLAPVAARAEVAPQGQPSLAALSEVLRIGDTVAVVREEGITYGRSLEDEMFPGRGGADWHRVVELVYDAQAMRRRFDAAFAAALKDDPGAVAAAVAFFGDARGQRLVGLEIDARKALLDEAAEDAARANFDELAAARDPRVDLLRRFAEANDLIESNVMGALNANLAFYRGMAEAGGLGEDMNEADMLADVWGQEGDIRTETERWLFPYLALAYGPATDADLEAYIAFSESPEGQRLNAALFAAFDAVFGTLSLDLGRATARQMMGEEI